MSKITHIVFHYSATYADQDIGVKEIDVMHRARGFKKVGYHYVIRRNGRIEAGRKETEIGAHVGNQNAGKIGICCIGGLDRATGETVGVDNRTAAQKAAQVQLTRDLLGRYPGAMVVGHKDLAPTQCPAYDVAAWWRSVNAPPAPVAVEVPFTQPTLAEWFRAFWASIFGKGA